MPDTPEETAERVTALREQGFTAVKLGWGPLGRDADHDVALARRRRAGGEGTEIMIDAGLGYVADAQTAIRVARESSSSASTGSRSRSSRTSTRRTPSSPTPSTCTIAAGEQDATRWGFRELIERGHVDLVQPDVTRCGGITETLRIAELELRDAEHLGDAAGAGDVRLDDVDAAALHQLAETPARRVLLARGDPDLDSVREFGVASYSSGQNGSSSQ